MRRLTHYRALMSIAAALDSRNRELDAQIADAEKNEDWSIFHARRNEKRGVEYALIVTQDRISLTKLEA